MSWIVVFAFKRCRSEDCSWEEGQKVGRRKNPLDCYNTCRFHDWSTLEFEIFYLVQLTIIISFVFEVWSACRFRNFHCCWVDSSKFSFFSFLFVGWKIFVWVFLWYILLFPHLFWGPLKIFLLTVLAANWWYVSWLLPWNLSASFLYIILWRRVRLVSDVGMSS